MTPRKRETVRNILTLLPLAVGLLLAGAQVLVILVELHRLRGCDLREAARFLAAGLLLTAGLRCLFALFWPERWLSRRRTILLLLLVLGYLVSPRFATRWLLQTGVVTEGYPTDILGVYVDQDRLVVHYETEYRVRAGVFEDRRRTTPNAERWGWLPIGRILATNRLYRVFEENGLRMREMAVPSSEYQVSAGRLPAEIAERAQAVPIILFSGRLADAMADPSVPKARFVLFEDRRLLRSYLRVVPEGGGQPEILSVNVRPARPDWRLPGSPVKIAALMPVAFIVDAVTCPLQWGGLFLLGWALSGLFR